MSRRNFAALLVLVSLNAGVPKERHFTFHYSFAVRNVPLGRSLRVWIPVAHSDRFQDVRIVSQHGDLSLRRTQEHEYGNVMLYAETSRATKHEYQFTVDYDVVRRERVVLASGKPTPGAHTSKPQVELTRFLQPDRLVPITGVPARLAAEQTKGAATPLERAHAIYEYVFRSMRYDKSGTGWGDGDALWACDAKRGNCTDFHSLFIAMVRSQHVPARFEVGFSLPPHRPSADVPAYHCWADFYINSIGWIPVDISEAWKHPGLHDFYFGAQDVNRLQFTIGRDLRLNPAQHGNPLNYFVYPYVELDAQQYSDVALAFSFTDLGTRWGGTH